MIFTLPGHAAPKSGNARRNPGMGFSDAITGCLQPPRGKNIRSEKELM
jgi:hypothetical protein